MATATRARFASRSIARAPQGGHSEQMTSNTLPAKHSRPSAAGPPLTPAGRPRTSGTHARRSRTHSRSSRTRPRRSRTHSRRCRTLPRGSGTRPRSSRLLPRKPPSRPWQPRGGRPSAGVWARRENKPGFSRAPRLRMALTGLMGESARHSRRSFRPVHRHSGETPCRSTMLCSRTM